MLEIKRVTKESVMTTDGKELVEGDGIILRVGKQDIVTKFKGIEKGYFATVNAEGDEVKYRSNSIEYCYKVLELRLDKEKDDE